jgi:aspartate/methionine/tyrosine aminotransferase
VFSERSGFDRAHNRVELARRAAATAGRTLLDLTESNPTRAQLPGLDAAFAALSAPAARVYEPEPFGLRSAREAASAWMARTHGVSVAPEQVVLTASTSEAYAFLFKLLCDPGDDVLVPTPSYPLFAHLAQLESVRAVGYPLAYDGRWHVTREALRRARTPRTRAIVTVHPNNPTGSFLSRAELADMAALGVPIISDEVFSCYAFTEDAARAPSAAAATDALVFSLHGLSKLAGLPQLKLSFMCASGPRAALDEALARLELIADAFLSVAAPVQVALPAILDAHAPVTQAIRARLERNLVRLRALCAGSAASLLHVEGGWYAVLRLPNVQSDERYALDFIEHAGVLVQPGYFYDFEGGPYVVLSLLTEDAAFEAGAARVLERVQHAAGRG